jgi:hypothetical protein
VVKGRNSDYDKLGWHEEVVLDIGHEPGPGVVLNPFLQWIRRIGTLLQHENMHLSVRGHSSFEELFLCLETAPWS